MPQNQSVIERLRSSPWPLSVCEIATLLDVDDGTAAMTVKLLADAGLARLNGDRWIFN
jgi:Mn-dependent DtxR family transcriptional regulator